MTIKKVTSNSPAISDYLEVSNDGVTSFVPIDPNNTDYAELMKLVEEDKITIEEVTE